ncbi:hypothetical protein FOZ63_021507, partial [Perkinsus olseni]
PATSRRSTTGRLERALGQLNSEQLLTLWSELMGAAVEVARGLQWLDQQLTQYYTPDDDDNSIVASSGKKGGADPRGQRAAASVMLHDRHRQQKFGPPPIEYVTKSSTLRRQLDVVKFRLKAYGVRLVIGWRPRDEG